jgi:ketosteroid isomerase-like protein
MKKYFLLIMVFCAVQAFAQNSQKEINEQVWVPFIENFNSYNTDGFMKVHSKDAVRSPRDAKTIWNWEEYRQKQDQNNQYGISQNIKQKLELHFTERIAKGDLAFDVGIYKATTTSPDGKSNSYYGRFHVVLRKENGVWKILVDTDSSENGTIDEKIFLSAKPME